MCKQTAAYTQVVHDIRHGKPSRQKWSFREKIDVIIDLELC